MEVCRLRAVVYTTKCFGKGLNSYYNIVTGGQLACISVQHRVLRRSMHSQRITQNMTYISNDKIQLKVDPKTMKLNQDRKKPLCIIMNWMLAQPKHVQKYAALYLGRGFDALAVSCTPWQLMWPTIGSQVVAGRLLSFLEQNAHAPLVLHGFSVGAYVWSELLIHAVNNKQLYQPVLDRIVAQVWDSSADIHEIPIGFPTAVFPRNKFLQELFRSYIKAHMKIFHYPATQHYKKGSDMFHATPCRAPTLFYVSKTDPIGAVRSNKDVQECWLNLGMKCKMKCWESSPHVLHYNHHPEEYRALLDAHLAECGLKS